jgi:hypothetical protein
MICDTDNRLLHDFTKFRSVKGIDGFLEGHAKNAKLCLELVDLINSAHVLPGILRERVKELDQMSGALGVIYFLPNARGDMS